MRIQNVSLLELQAVAIYIPVPRGSLSEALPSPLLHRCAPTHVSDFFSIYKLEIFSDGYTSPKFIPHEILKRLITVDDY